MATAPQPNALPKAPLNTPQVLSPNPPAFNPTDFARALDMLVFHLQCDNRMDAGDVAELAAISARLKASIAH